jgi:hypothetical protein
MLWPTCGVVGLTFNETQARQDSRKGEQSRRLVEAIAVCRMILAQHTSATRLLQDGLETGQAMLVDVLPFWLAFPCAGQAPSWAIFSVGRGQAVCDERRLPVCADRCLHRVRLCRD